MTHRPAWTIDEFETLIRHPYLTEVELKDVLPGRSAVEVAIVGDDGIRYYGSQLSARVEVGQLLSLTGDTGNTKGTDLHLHFGISRPTPPDDWQVRRGQVYPQPYLEARGERYSSPQSPLIYSGGCSGICCFQVSLQ